MGCCAIDHNSTAWAVELSFVDTLSYSLVQPHSGQNPYCINQLHIAHLGRVLLGPQTKPLSDFHKATLRLLFTLQPAAVMLTSKTVVTDLQTAARCAAHL
jgi:hypothetical protein